tara:strand:+ start:204 stop:584 length:381 start_codon:yes stop_codon:yes gene_type:complete
MALKYDFTKGTGDNSTILVRYLGGLSGDADVTFDEKTRIVNFMDSKSSSYLKYGIETLDTGAIWLVVDFRDVDEKNEFRHLVWNTSERRNATNGTNPHMKKGTTNDGTGHPSHKDESIEKLKLIEE